MKPQTFVYVVEAQCGLIKIGVSRNPLGRAATIHVHSPFPCRLIAFWPGKGVDEQQLHRAFAELRSHAEWFRISGPVAAFVAAVRGQGVESVPEWHEVVWLSPGARRPRQRELQSAAMRRKWADPDWRAEYLRIRQGYRERDASASSAAEALTTSAVSSSAPRTSGLPAFVHRAPRPARARP